MRRRSRRRGDRSPLVPLPIPRSGRAKFIFFVTDNVISFRSADSAGEACYNPIIRDCNVSGSGPDRSRQPREFQRCAGGASSRQPEQWRELWSALRQREQRPVERELELRRRPYPCPVNSETLSDHDLRNPIHIAFPWIRKDSKYHPTGIGLVGSVSKSRKG